MESSPLNDYLEHPDNPDYQRWVGNYEDAFWSPKDIGENAHLICQCGSYKFKIINTDAYETTGECVECGRRGVVHSG